MDVTLTQLNSNQATQFTEMGQQLLAVHHHAASALKRSFDDPDVGALLAWWSCRCRLDLLRGVRGVRGRSRRRNGRGGGRSYAWAKKAAPEIPQALKQQRLQRFPTPGWLWDAQRISGSRTPITCRPPSEAKLERQPKPGVQERILLHLRDYVDYKSASRSVRAVSNGHRQRRGHRPVKRPRAIAAQGPGWLSQAHVYAGWNAGVFPDRWWHHHRRRDVAASA